MALTDRQYFTLRRLQSLTGVVPVGVFLLEHWFTNAFALGGAAAYNEKVEFLRSLPYLFLLEVFGIFLPIAFHAVV
ncbi:MAG: succinate dehydrogenase subunit, partial [Acidobacteria bacterium]|nr:succinate dehydrogenase subunit [Acidobacteriota bacterium]